MNDEPVRPGWERCTEEKWQKRLLPFGVIYVHEYTDPDEGAGWTWTLYMGYNGMLQRVARGPVTNAEGVRLVLATPEAAAEGAYTWLRTLARQIRHEVLCDC